MEYQHPHGKIISGSVCLSIIFHANSLQHFCFRGVQKLQMEKFAMKELRLAVCSSVSILTVLTHHCNAFPRTK